MQPYTQVTVTTCSCSCCDDLLVLLLLFIVIIIVNIRLFIFLFIMIVVYLPVIIVFIWFGYLSWHFSSYERLELQHKCSVCHACAVRVMDCDSEGAMSDIVARQARQKHNPQ